MQIKASFRSRKPTSQKPILTFRMVPSHLQHPSDPLTCKTTAPLSWPGICQHLGQVLCAILGIQSGVAISRCSGSPHQTTTPLSMMEIQEPTLKIPGKFHRAAMHWLTGFLEANHEVCLPMMLLIVSRLIDDDQASILMLLQMNKTWRLSSSKPIGSDCCDNVTGSVSRLPDRSISTLCPAKRRAKLADAEKWTADMVRSLGKETKSIS